MSGMFNYNTLHSRFKGLGKSGSVQNNDEDRDAFDHQFSTVTNKPKCKPNAHNKPTVPESLTRNYLPLFRDCFENAQKPSFSGPTIDCKTGHPTKLAAMHFTPF